MKQSFFDHIHAELESIDQQGLFKRERIINSHQKADVTLSTGNQVINLCANNYLGLADNSELIEVAQSAISEYG
ncbi:hypothetical protein [Pseudomonas soli]|nr:hypothetical protein O165_024175 [Pseudomonas soli]